MSEVSLGSTYDCPYTAFLESTDGLRVKDNEAFVDSFAKAHEAGLTDHSFCRHFAIPVPQEVADGAVIPSKKQTRTLMINALKKRAVAALTVDVK